MRRGRCPGPSLLIDSGISIPRAYRYFGLCRGPPKIRARPRRLRGRSAHAELRRRAKSNTRKENSEDEGPASATVDFASTDVVELLPPEYSTAEEI